MQDGGLLVRDEFKTKIIVKIHIWKFIRCPTIQLSIRSQQLSEDVAVHPPHQPQTVWEEIPWCPLTYSASCRANKQLKSRWRYHDRTGGMLRYLPDRVCHNGKNLRFFQASTSERRVLSLHVVKFLFFQLFLTFSLFRWVVIHVCLFSLSYSNWSVWQRRQGGDLCSCTCTQFQVHCGVQSKCAWIHKYCTQSFVRLNLFLRTETSMQRYKMKSMQVFGHEAPDPYGPQLAHFC